MSRENKNSTPSHPHHAQFLQLLLPLQRSLYHFARSLVNDHEEASDLVGEALLSALQNYDSNRPVETFRSYLFTIVTRIHRRKRRRAQLFAVGSDELFENIRSRFTEPDIPVDIAALYYALSRLPDKQREALALFELSGLSLKEIREIQGGSLSGVKSRIVRGREQLARLLGVREQKEEELVDREGDRTGDSLSGAENYRTVSHEITSISLES